MSLFATFSTDSKSGSNFAFFVAHLAFLRKKVLFLDIILALFANFEDKRR
jgi:hypothetical protein